MKRLLSSRGFTLAELLTVVAILAALVTIGIPVYGNVLERAHRASCADNCSKLQALLSSAYLMDGDIAAEFAAKKETYACPDGGSISWSQDYLSDDITVRCSIHNPGMTVQSMTDIVSIIQTNSVKVNSNGSTSPLSSDSTAPPASNENKLAGSADRCRTALAQAGFDLAAMDISAWRYNQSTSSFIWTTVDITTLPDKAKIPIVRYNLLSGNITVYTSEVQVKTAGSDVYNIINDGAMTGYKPSTSTADEGNQTLEKALEYYDQLLADKAFDYLRP